jgi:hypothetical protein
MYFVLCSILVGCNLSGCVVPGWCPDVVDGMLCCVCSWTCSTYVLCWLVFVMLVAPSSVCMAALLVVPSPVFMVVVNHQYKILSWNVR